MAAASSAAAAGSPAGECYFQLGPKTLRIPMTLFSDNRRRLCERLRAKGVPENAVVVLQGGISQLRDDTDHEPLFRQESFFHHQFGVLEPDCYGAIRVSDAHAVLFVPHLPEEYAWFMGRIKAPVEFQQQYAVDHCAYVAQLAEELKKLAPGEAVPVLLSLMGTNSDSGNKPRPLEFKGMEDFTVDSTVLYRELIECRAIKTKAELEVMRYTNKVSSEAHKEVMKIAKPGMMEFQCESHFKHYVYNEGGCRNVSYTCICGAGHNGSVLHYGHAAAPNDCAIKDGDMCLFDMGGEYGCYASDITCSFPANGKFTERQKQIYNTVLKSSRAVLATIKPGVHYAEMHRLADRVHCEELKKHGLLKGDVDEMMKVHVGSVFMPHGLGHMIGLDTHDPAGYKEGEQRKAEPGLRSLRLGRELQEGNCITVEPGVYFIDVLLDGAKADPARSKFFNWDVVDSFRGFGGVRIEDDVYITADGHEMLTQVPRTVEEIEAFMAEARK